MMTRRKEGKNEKLSYNRAAFFLLIGTLVCVSIVFKLAGREADQRTVPITNVSPILTESVISPQIPADELEAGTTDASISENNEIAAVKPFNPDVFVDDRIHPVIRRDDPSRKLGRGSDKEDEDESEEEREKEEATLGREAVIFRNLQLKDENGEIPLDGMERAKEQVKAMQAEQDRRAKLAGKPDGLEIAGLAPGDWTWQGPGNIGGRMRSIVIHPTDPNKMWVGSVGGGIWKTTNAGALWSPVNDFMANLAVSTMAIDPTNPSVMYAGTGEFLFGNNENPINGLQGARGDGVFKTTDGGVTWNQLAQTKVSDPVVCPAIATCPWTFVNRMAISPDGSTILAATSSGIHRSADGGATWTRVTASLVTPYFDIDFDPTNSQLAVAGSNTSAAYSTDGGQTWTVGAFTPGIGGSDRVELAYAPSSPNIVYASVSQNGGEVYQSTDWGQSFTQVNTGNTLLSGQGIYTNIIWVNPQDPTFLIVGSVDLWRSTDSGANFARMSRWQSAPSTSAHADHHMIIAHPGFDNNTNKTVYFGNDGGIYRTTDVSTATTTTGWTNLNNSLGITQFYGAAANAAGVIVGGTQDNGSLRSNAPNTNGWTSTSGGDGGFAAADPTDTNYFYTEYISLGIQRSTNGGASASYIYCNPAPATGNGGTCMAPAVGITDAFNGANFVAPFILDPNEPNRLLAGGVSLWRSNDIKATGLPTWAAIKAPSPTGQPISAIAVAKGNSDFIVVGHNDGQIFLSQDGTAAAPAWVRIDNGTPARFATRIAIDTTRLTPWIYATFGGFRPNNVWRTEDLGLTWIDVTGSGATGLPDIPVRSIVINPARQDQIYVGTEIGIFASDDAGANWAIPQGGPANVSVDELFWNNGLLYAATHGRGIYRTNTASFAAPSCLPVESSCPCRGEWFCGCSWPSGFPPDTTNDVYIGCPMTVNANGTFGSVIVKNLTLGGGLTLFNNAVILTSEDFANYGVTQSSPNIASGYITARNFFNSGIVSVGMVDVTGNLTNGGIMSITQGVEASKNILTGETSQLGANSVYAGGDFLNYSAAPLTLATDLSIGGNFHTQGRVQGRFLGQVVHFNGGFPSKTYSGPGVLKFQSAGTGTGLTLANDKTFEGGTFHISGPLNLGTNSMAVTDNTSFTGTGAVSGTGTIFLTPRSGVQTVFSYNNANFTPTMRFVSGTAVVTGQPNLIGGPVIIDSGATLLFNSSNLTVNGNLTNNGRITAIGLSSSQLYFNGTVFTNNGEITTSAENPFSVGFNTDTVPRAQVIAGLGSWSPSYLDLGGASTVTLNNDMTFSGGTLRTQGTTTFNIGANTLTHRGSLLGAQILGTGTIKMQPTSGSATYQGNSGPGMRIISGTVMGAGSVTGPLVVESGATLTLNSFFTARSDVTIDGTLNRTGTQYLNATGNGTFLNNGSISADVYLGPFSGSTNVLQNLGGAGTWNPTYLSFVSRSTVTLVSDVNYAGTNLVVEGPGVRVNTGAFTFSFPCTTVLQNSGEISGNIRRTNLAACPGAALTFGNPFTTIRFTSGTPPSDIRVETSSTQPAGFLNAVRRSFQITPTGGSGFAATLRLRYFDSELNGNTESSLQLWRHDGTAWTPQGATSRDTSSNWVEYAGVTQFSPWAISGFAPTAAGVSVSGRVTSADGRGLRNVKISVTDQVGNVRTALTSSLGYYQFEDIEAGQTVVIAIVAKGYLFANPTRIVTVQEELGDIDFTAEP